MEMVLQNDFKGNMKKTSRDANTARALAVVRFVHRPPQTHPQTHRQDRLQNIAPLASAQCNYSVAEIDIMFFFFIYVMARLPAIICSVARFLLFFGPPAQSL